MMHSPQIVNKQTNKQTNNKISSLMKCERYACIVLVSLTFTSQTVHIRNTTGKAKESKFRVRPTIRSVTARKYAF